MPTPIIQLKNLTYEIGGRTILRDISMDINARDVFVVMGLSGAGKSTLLRLIAGLIRPTSGSLLVLGQDITTMSEQELNSVRAHMGFVFQFGALFDSLTVRENVGFRFYEHTTMEEDEIRKVVTEKLGLVGMANTENLFPAELSGGMQKRVGIARALLGDPEILLYDEPTSGLDPVIAAAIDELIVHLRDTLGVTSVIVSHDITSVMRMADRMALLYQGSLRLIGTADEFRTSDDPVVRQFIEGNTEGPIQVV